MLMVAMIARVWLRLNISSRLKSDPANGAKEPKFPTQPRRRSDLAAERRNNLPDPGGG